MLEPRKSLVVTSKALVKAVTDVGEIGLQDPAVDELVVADRIGQQVVRLLRLVSRLRHQGGDVAVAHVLMELLDRGPQRVGEIAQSLGTDPSTVSRQVTALVEAGLVERRAHPGDGRAHLLAATESGEHRCVAGRRRRVDVVAAVLADWPAEDRLRLADLLGRFADDMHARDIPARDTPARDTPARDIAVGDRRTVRRPGGEN